MNAGIRALAAALTIAVAVAKLPRGAGAEEAGPPKIPAVESRIDRVLLYSDRALVIRTGRVEVGAGRTKMAFEGLPGKLADYSVTAALTGPGGGQIANIEIEPVYKTGFRSKEAEEAAKELKDLEREMLALQDQYAAAQAEGDFARTLKIGARPPAAGEAKPLPLAPDAWAAVLDFLGQSLHDVAQRQDKLAEQMDEVRTKIVVASARARLLLSYKNELTKRVILEIAADQPVARGVEVSYIVPDAAWFPRYDVRADMAAGMLEVVSYGLVRQESGEDWTDIQLSFSGAEPSMAANLPELASWRIAAVQPPVPQVMPSAVAPPMAGEAGGVLKERTQGLAYYNGQPAASKTALPQGMPGGTAGGMNEGAAGAAFMYAAAPLAREVKLHELAEKDAADLRQSLETVGGFINTPPIAGLPAARQAQTEAESQSQAGRIGKQIFEIEQLNATQQQARDKKDWQEFAAFNEMLNDRIATLPPANQNSLRDLQLNVNANLEMAQRWLESQKLEHGLIAPVASSGGYDYRWQALRRESVPSDGALTKAVLLRQQFPAEFVYEIAAEKSKMAFLHTKLKNSTRSPFLAGPVSVFLGPDFVGESSLKTTAPSEEFGLGLGADEAVAVERRVETKRDTRGLFTSDYRFNVGITVAVRNGKSKPISVAVLERMPYTFDNKLTISEGQFEPPPTIKDQDRPKLVTWELKLAPGVREEIKMSYWYQHAANLSVAPTELPR
jgi:hypothetical protein